MLRQELAKVRKNRLLMVTLIVVMLIPSIYSTIFLKSMWDTYERMDNFPVAVINQDKAVHKAGKDINIGEELTKKLDESSDMDFKPMSAEEARKGLDEGKYYLALTIPEDFSADSLTLMDKEPKPMNLTYETSAGHNFTSSKFSEIATGRIKNEVQTNVTRTYAKTVLEQFKKAGLGLEQAGDGAKTLANGLTQLADGSGKLGDGVSQLNNGLGAFGTGLTTYTNGVGTAANGTQQLAAGGSKLQDGVNQYTNGVNQAAAKAPELAQGVQQYTNGVDTLAAAVPALASGLETYTAGVDKLATGVTPLSAGSQQLTDGLAELNAKTHSTDVNTLTAGMKKYKDTVDGLKQMSQGASPEQKQILANMQSLETQLKTLGALSQSPDLSAKDKTALLQSMGAMKTNLEELAATLQAQSAKAGQLGALADGYNELYTGMNTYVASTQAASAQLAPGAKKISDGVNQVSAGLDQLTQNSAALNGGTAAAAAGLQQLEANSGKLADGSQLLAGGLGQLQNKSGDLQSGASQAVGGINQLNAGLSQLNANTGRLQSAVSQLSDGSGQLVDGAGQLKVGLVKANDGADELGTKLTEGGEQIKQVRADKANVDMFASPVTETHKDRTTVKNNGTGMAPYMIAIYVFVGMITLMAAMNLTEPASYPKSAFTWWLSKYTIPFVLVFVGAIITTLVSIGIIGLTPVNLPAFLISLIVIAIMDMSIVYFFTAAFGKIGTFLSLILLVLQLSASGGTYPIELSSGFFQWLHPLLPMTYAIQALRGSLSTGLSVTEPVLVMLMIFVVFSLLSLGYFVIQKAKRYRFDGAETESLDNN